MKRLTHNKDKSFIQGLQKILIFLKKIRKNNSINR